MSFEKFLKIRKINQIIIINNYTLKMSFFNQGLWDRKSSMEKPGLGRTADMATQYPPEELRRMLSGNPGRLSINVSIPPLLRPDTWTLWTESKYSIGSSDKLIS